MDNDHFDAAVRAWTTGTARRTLLGLVAGSLIGQAGLNESSAKGKKKRRGKKPKAVSPPVSPPPASPPVSPPPPPTEPTCAPYNSSCIPDGDCCSRVCAYFDMALNWCDKGSAGTECHDGNDCASGSCQGYRCT